MIYNYIIIGAGIVGLSTAYKLSLSNPNASITVLEKEDEVAAHQTGRNSGVIHSGIYYTPGSYKAKNCIDGRHQLVDFCKEYGIDHNICGKVIVATHEGEVEKLNQIYKRGLQNNIEGIAMIGKDKLKDIEPYVNGVQAIHVPCAGIVDFKGVCLMLEQLLKEKGHTIRFGQQVQNIVRTNGTTSVQTKTDHFKTNFVINCAGLFSDRVAKSAGISSPVKIVPFRGEYFKLSDEAESKVNGLIYPLPNPEFPFLGVHFTRMAKGGVECGPNAVFAFKREGYSKLSFNLKDTIETTDFPGFWRMAGEHWKMGLKEMYRSLSKDAFLKELQKLIPSINREDLNKCPSGVRAMALQNNGEILDDFYFEKSTNALHVLNAPSPAATAGLSIGDQIVEKIQE
jgi:(S)-2-hydroxyglutarate dehydrogenase